MSRDHRKLRAFELADDFVVAIYQGTNTFPRHEAYGLTSQMRRAAVSVAANIVEGCARTGEREYSHFLNMAFGSLREVGYYLTLAQRLGYLTPDEGKPLEESYNETARVLNELIRSLKSVPN